MLRTAYDGRLCGYRKIYRFDLKPVFNKTEEYLSEFDRFRISLISGLYQKKYGYTYEDITKFSRKKTWEMFLEEFRYQKKLKFADEKERKTYYLRIYEALRRSLWEVRKYGITEDVEPLFTEIEISQSMNSNSEEKESQLAFLKELVWHEKLLVLYGIGRDCERLLTEVGEKALQDLIFCDKKAANEELFFHGKKVISQKELGRDYREYNILVTSSKYYKVIRKQLEEMGIARDRIICNTVPLWSETQ